MKILIVLAILLYSAAWLLTIFRRFVIIEKNFLVSKCALALGLILHSIVIIERAYHSGRLPVASVAETMLVYSWAVSALVLLVWWRYRELYTTVVAFPAAMVTLLVSLLKLSPPRELPLILKTYWFEIHVIGSFVSYALFTLSFAAALLYLLSSRVSSITGRARDFSDIAVRGLIWGFFFFSAAMFSGAVWGYVAWGTYWMWEPKILWSFVLWFAYAGAMHAYYVKDWKIKGLAVGSLIGFVVMLFTWIGVGLLMKSSHSF